MKIAATVLAAAALLATSTNAQVNDAPLILGGTIVPAGTKTYTTGLRDTAAGTDFCGGSLITPKHVLTAAHCAGIAYAAVGTHYLSGSTDGERIAVVKETKYPTYGAPNENTNDFLILELATASKFAPIALSSAVPAVGSTTTVIGWGATKEGGSQSRELLRVDVPVVANDVCKTAVAKTGVVDATMICAGGAKAKDSCQGDSGGPLVVAVNSTTDALVGVVSWGEGCGQTGKPGVYARVSTALTWIKSVAPGVTIV
ncbi:hypothetical protein Gpo141_00014935, partial [Globisporangium polare]